MKKKHRIMAVLLSISSVTMILLSCALKKDKPIRIYEPYIVEKGETLWDISEQFTQGDKRAWIYDICQMNNLIDCNITEGETIYVYEGK